MRRLLALVAVLLLLGAVPAAAHDPSGHGAAPVASDLRSTVVAADLPPGVSLEVLQNGDALRLRNDTAADVRVERPGEPGLVVPTGAAGQWHLDAAHPDPAVTGPAEPVRPWSVDVVVDGRARTVDGEVRWSPGPSPVPWVAVALAVAVAGAVLVRRRAEGLALLLGGAVVASGAHTAAELAARTAEGPRWALLGGYLPLAACWALGAGAVALLGRGRRDASWAAALSAAGLLVASLVGDVAVLGASTVVVALPADLDRVLVALGTGLAAGSLATVPLLARAPSTAPVPDAS